MGRAWHQMTWAEIGQCMVDGMDTAMLPIGATEQHGPHLGCGMDTELVAQLCRAAAEATGALLLPTLPFGCSIGHSKRWPGTLALQPTTMIAVVREIGDWTYASGCRRLILVNSHVGNAAPLRCALEMLRAEYDDLMVALLNSAQLSERVKACHVADAEDWHANAAETALMQAIAPDLVRAEKIRSADDPDRTTGCVFAHPVNRTSRNGVTGTPSEARVSEGQTLFAWMVEDLTDLVRRAQRETPPLPFGYTEPYSTYQETP